MIFHVYQIKNAVSWSYETVKPSKLCAHVDDERMPLNTTAQKMV